MQSTLLHPASAAETPRSVPPAACATDPRKRDQGLMRGVGFVPLFWLTRAINDGLLPNSRACLVAIAIAGAVDPDGRWCFLHRHTIIQRCGGHVSVSTVGRALNDLEEAGIIRRLSRRRVRTFFDRDVQARVRSADRLPDVVELMIPASAFPDQTLAEINEVRARAGEEPLDATTRPRRPVGTAPHPERPPAHPDTPRPSDRPTDLVPTDPSPDDPSPSVRARAPQREGAASTAADCPTAPQLARIPDARLRAPRADRIALDRAARRLLDAGLAREELTAVLGDATGARRPFAALMRRLRSPEDARAYLDGRLGQGVHPRPPDAWPTVPGPRSGPAVSPPEWEAKPDPFARPPEFVLDRSGNAPRTCPDHPGIRNAPGGTCRACGRPCRTIPGELMHPPAVARAGSASHEVTIRPRCGEVP